MCFFNIIVTDKFRYFLMTFQWCSVISAMRIYVVLQIHVAQWLRVYCNVVEFELFDGMKSVSNFRRMLRKKAFSYTCIVCFYLCFFNL